MSRNYERWKAGEKVWKAPWVIEYYKSITDENQYKLGNKVFARAIVIISAILFLYGLFFGAVFL